ncbi:MAG: inorganic phosphate transporter [Bacteroidales bacterium]|nr:inorganic phosphate transporter [Bacteroidales bacterium]
MEYVYLFFVVALLILAVADLSVGVGNDAVNFLNSSIGARVAPFFFIMSIAALGVLVGSIFSSGMMEVARSGIFNPDQFYFSEIMIIFLAVMITDMILLDAFNTFGLQTSTTVSIVFELLGAAVAIGMIKSIQAGNGLQELGSYINSGRALAIISAILLSVVIAFTVGTLVQFLTRLLFTFNYEKKIPFIGALWGGASVSAIFYFLLLKGASGASFIQPETLAWIDQNASKLMLYFFISFTVLFQLLISLFKVNILKIVILTGTFALAMAFASNDLVNFIGVPLAGLESYMLFLSDPTINPDTHTMESLLDPVRTPTIYLLIAGVIMIVTLMFSKKSKSVTQTEIDLARQGEGYERFSSTALARNVLRMGLEINKFFVWILPDAVLKRINKSFEKPANNNNGHNRKNLPYFDHLRASVNLVVASSLIALATSLKLPLSTTYVTFMVAMGTSLSDRAWGRESAVYRITGVITVIGGWFFTAFAAFSLSLLIALFIYWGGIIAAVIAVAAAFAIIIKTYHLHKIRAGKRKAYDEKQDIQWDENSIMVACRRNIKSTLAQTAELYKRILLYLQKEDRKKLRASLKHVRELNLRTKDLKADAYITVQKLQEDAVESSHYYIQILDYLREIAHSINFLAEPAYEYIDNNHPPFTRQQTEDLNALGTKVSALLYGQLKLLETNDFEHVNNIINQQKHILNNLQELKKKQLRMIKNEEVGTRNSLLFLNILQESKNLILYSVNMLKAHRDFILYKNIPPE